MAAPNIDAFLDSDPAAREHWLWIMAKDSTISFDTWCYFLWEHQDQLDWDSSEADVGDEDENDWDEDDVAAELLG